MLEIKITALADVVFQIKQKLRVPVLQVFPPSVPDCTLFAKVMTTANEAIGANFSRKETSVTKYQKNNRHPTSRK